MRTMNESPPDEGPAEAEESPAFVVELAANTRRLYVYISTLLPLPSEAEDVFQQTCLALWRKRRLYSPERPFLAWAYGFARNEVLRHLRNSRSPLRYLSQDLLEEIASREEAVAPPADEARRSALDSCLEQMLAPQRALLERCYQGTESIKDIAGEMRLSPAALTMRLQRLRHALAKCIDRTITAMERTT
jgi:RNA polymerase sigma-70 factor (ECF subfamily)